MVSSVSSVASLLIYFLFFSLEVPLFKLLTDLCILLRPLTGFCWRTITLVGGKCVRKNELKRLSLCTTRHYHKKLKKFYIASKRSNQDE